MTTNEEIMEASGALLREITILHDLLQRESVACCGDTTSTQCSIITELGRGGEMTLAALGRRLGLDKGWLSRTVELLVQEGLLHKAPGENDRRTILISLTAAGQARFHELNETLDGLSARVMGRIPAHERENVQRALELLRHALLAETVPASATITLID
jgi:DNA-binding MarR family transcriptional regulator